MKLARQIGVTAAGIAADIGIELGILKLLTMALEAINTEEFIEKHTWLSLIVLILYIGLSIASIGLAIFFTPFTKLAGKLNKKLDKKSEKEEFLDD